MVNDISNQQFPLPEDVLKLKHAGDFSGALRKIAYLLERDRTPEPLRRRLELEQHVIEALCDDQYPYSIDEAQQIMKDGLADYREDELERYRECGAADWIFIDGHVRFNRRFFANLASTRPELETRLLVRTNVEESIRDKALRDEQVRLMALHGGRTARITVHLGLRVKKPFERPGVPVLVHLPLPRECRQISEIHILAHGPGEMTIAPADALQRTIAFSKNLQCEQEFWVEFSYVNHVDYLVLDPAVAAEAATCRPAEGAHSEYLVEQAPHIVFTPYLRALAAEIVGDETNPLVKARRIYDFITTNVMYSYVRRYDTIDDLSEYAAVNLKGDCGIQALLFITLCRICGIPARWQSGLYVTPEEIGCHDWAEFFIAPYGWLFCDCSFGGGAWRGGKTDRWNHYFGNLDVLRLPASGAIQTPFDPPKRHWRGDPIDNQRGEMEYEDAGLSHSQIDFLHRTISFEWMD
ncbi:MAG: transglutaminase-like domain-containing protein [Sphaerochaetaceae bacterium]|jgi:hypothetical protein